MKLDYSRYITGFGFKFSPVDASFLELPFGFTLAAGKSIAAWISNPSSSQQNLFTNTDSTQFIRFTSGAFEIKTSLGTTYTAPLSIGTGSNLQFCVFSVTLSNVLFVAMHSPNGVSNVAQFQLQAGEKIEFANKVFVGRTGGGGDYMYATIDDISFWNRALTTNEGAVMANRSEGVRADQLPFSADLLHYIPLDELSLISRTTKDLVTGADVALNSPKFKYFNPHSAYFYNSADYIVANDETDWDIDAIEAPVNDLSKSLTITYIFNSDVSYPVGAGVNLGVIFQLGDDSQSSYLRVNIGQGNSSGSFISNLVSVSDAGQKIVSVPPTATVPAIVAGQWHVQTFSITSAGTRCVLNGVKIFDSTAVKLPLGYYNINKLLLGKVAFGSLYQFFGFLREVSILTKVMTDAEIINLHKNYLGLAVGDTPTGLPDPILGTTAYSLEYDFLPADIFAYWKGNRVNASGVDDVQGLVLEDSSGNNRYLRLMDYVFPVFPSVARVGGRLDG